jgi:hypothetical protein
MFGKTIWPAMWKPDLTPRSHEQVHLVPGIKADAKLPVFKKPVHLRERRFKPGVVVVVYRAAPAAVVVIHQIGRVGQNEMDRPGEHISFMTSTQVTPLSICTRRTLMAVAREV